MKTFCTNCGGAINYESIRPNFCPDCGTPLGGAKASSTTRSRPAPYNPPARRPVYPEYQEHQEEPEISPDELGFSLKKKNAPVMAESVVGTGATGFGSRPQMRKEDIEAFNKKLQEERAEPIEIN